MVTGASPDRRSPVISLFSSRRNAILGLAFGLFTAACTPPAKAPSPPVTVFAAASLTDALGEIAVAYETATGQPVRLSFGASGAVARQIQAGAPADLVVLADPVWMDRLQAAQLLEPGSRVDLLKNRLVLIAPASAVTGADPFAWLTSAKSKLVIGDPDSVPAGDYARTWLRKTGRWDGLQPAIVTAADVRAVRTFVERGEAGLGVVYRSDTVGAPGVKIVGEPAAADQPTILYPAAMTRDGATTAKSFMDFLRGPEAARIFVAHGFDPVP
jgi:molybdate transport system substrate-binding protein